MEQSITADNGVPPKKKSKLDTENLNPPKSSSYVWHYFDAIMEFAKCKICQHQISLDDSQGTSMLMEHLKSVHTLTDKNLFTDDLGSIPIMCVSSSNKSLCMYERVFQSFKDIGKGFWQCEQCYYTIQKRTLYPMFEHLKNRHWRASQRKSETIHIENRIGIVDNSSNELVVNNQQTRVNITEHVTTHPMQTDSPNTLKTIQINEPRMSNDMGDKRNVRRSLVKNDRITIRGLLDGKANLESDSEKHYKVRISLPDGNEVEGFYLGSDCQPEINMQSENAIDVVYNYMNNGERTGSPIVLEKPSSSSSSNVQRAVEDRISRDSENDTSNSSRVLLEDGQKEFNHSYTAKSTENPTATSPSVAKVGQSFQGTETSLNTTNDCIIIKEENLDLEELEIQVPLQYVPGLIAGVNCDKNVRSSPSYEYIKTEKAGKEQNVAVITLVRPSAMNALCNKLMNELNDAVTKFDDDGSVGAIIITGSDKAFAAGNDVKEMQNYTYTQAIKENVRVSWNSISKASKPVIAAVNGYALGGGCELAMMCDIIYAGENARFGQSEIVFGTIPGAGGTQRLARAIGKSKAMEMLLTGNQITAVEAEKSGLISKVFPPEKLLSEAIKLGERISTHSQLIVSMAKEAVNSAYETKLQEGLRLEKKIYCGTLATADRKEGMAAFIEKRPPKFKNE